MAREIFIRNEGGATRTLLRHYGVSGKLEHVRHVREDLAPHIDRAAAMAKSEKPGKEYRYEGSIPRIVLDKWLKDQGKTWHHWAVDRDLKAKFLVWFRTEFSKMAASSYRERSLAINRTTAPKLGATILSNYRRELAHAT
jgi:hypothetical protein